MFIISVVAILLTINMVLMHGHYLYKCYNWAYRKLIKPKFKVGEFVMIGDVEFEIIHITTEHRPYTYYCYPVRSKKYSQYYYHESLIKKKSGLLKELE